jgi:IS5 family transposase
MWIALRSCGEWAKPEAVSWRRSYVRTVPALLARLRTRSNRLVKERKKCSRKIKTITGRFLRDFKRNLGLSGELLYPEKLELIERVLQQKRHDKNKVYSLHDPEVLCIAKGKAHKKYEFGRKASVTMLRDSGVIVSAVSFKDNSLRRGYPGTCPRTSLRDDRKDKQKAELLLSEEATKT